MNDSDSIRKKSYELGFSACGFASAEALPLEGLFDTWLNNSFHGQMKFMEGNKDLRLDPGLLFPGAKTVISLLASYQNEEYTPDKGLKVSRYAVGRDYHKVLRKRGQKLIDWLASENMGMKARVFVDSAPIMEKEWARRGGLGWIGKNTCLIRPGEGSWFFIAIILTDLDIHPDKPEERNLCGNCSRCIDACPTQALHSDGFLDATKCISYLTIELKDSMPDSFKGKTDKWLFGCDVCQEVCPTNRFARQSGIEEFKPREILRSLSPEDILNMNDEKFERDFLASPLKRAGLDKLKRTTTFLYPDD